MERRPSFHGNAPNLADQAEQEKPSKPGPLSYVLERPPNQEFRVGVSSVPVVC